jgi:Uma2 family endonuclease
MLMATEMATWTVAQRDRLPDDGNKYEVVGGELFVTPSPSVRHQIIADSLAGQLRPFVLEQRLGIVFDIDTDVIKGNRNVVVPDVTVYPFTRDNHPENWVEAPRPILVAEIRSPATWRRDVARKRDLYVALRIPDYWIVDGDARTVTVVRPGCADEVISDVLRWQPARASRALEINVAELMR